MQLCACSDTVETYENRKSANNENTHTVTSQVSVFLRIVFTHPLTPHRRHFWSWGTLEVHGDGGWALHHKNTNTRRQRPCSPDLSRPLFLHRASEPLALPSPPSCNQDLQWIGLLSNPSFLLPSSLGKARGAYLHHRVDWSHPGSAEQHTGE